MNTFIKLISLMLVLIIILAAVAGCGNKDNEDAAETTVFTYDDYVVPETEPYNYDLREYVNVCDYTAITVPEYSVSVTESDLERDIKTKIAYFSDFTTYDSPSDGVTLEQWDYANVSYTTYYTDKLDSMVADARDFNEEGKYYFPAMRDDDDTLLVGQQKLGVEGIDEGMVGMQIGETRTIEFTFPTPYYQKPVLSGNHGVIEITLKSIDRVEFLEYNDAFVNNFYTANSTDIFEQDIISQIRTDRTTQLENYQRALALEYVVKNSEVLQYPEYEYTEIIDSAYDYYGGLAEDKSLTLEEYVSEEFGLTYDMFAQWLDIYARETMKIEMVTRFIARSCNITITQDEYEDFCWELTKQYEPETFDQVQSVIDKNYGTEFVVSMILENKVFDHVAGVESKG